MAVEVQTLAAELGLMQPCDSCLGGRGGQFCTGHYPQTCPVGKRLPTLEEVLDALEEEGYEDVSFIRWNGWFVNTPKGDLTMPEDAEGCRERVEAALLLLKEVRHGV